MHAFDFLIKEHQYVKKMFADINNEAHHFETQRKNFAVLASFLLLHEAMEHLIWYPRFKDNLPDTVKYLIKEEKHAEKAIKKLEELKTETSWQEHFLKLNDDMLNHAREEETELFPEVKKILSEKELHEIGLKMLEFKKEYF